MTQMFFMETPLTCGLPVQPQHNGLSDGQVYHLRQIRGTTRITAMSSSKRNEAGYHTRPRKSREWEAVVDSIRKSLSPCGRGIEGEGLSFLPPPAPAAAHRYAACGQY